MESKSFRDDVVQEHFTIESECQRAIRAWLNCSADKRPSPEALGQMIADIVVDACSVV